MTKYSLPSIIRLGPTAPIPTTASAITRVAKQPDGLDLGMAIILAVLFGSLTLAGIFGVVWLYQRARKANKPIEKDIEMNGMAKDIESIEGFSAPASSVSSLPEVKKEEDEVVVVAAPAGEGIIAVAVPDVKTEEEEETGVEIDVPVKRGR